MNQLIKLAAVALVFCGISNTANAYVLTFLLDVKETTWEFKLKTDAPGGIASFAVDLVGVATGVSVAPRGIFDGDPVTGFTLGNEFTAQRASAWQNTSNAALIVYGLGRFDVPPSAFGAPSPFTLIGSGIRDGHGFVTMYHGTNTSPFSAWFKSSQPDAFGSVFGTVGSPTAVGQVIGPGINLVAQFPTPEPSAITLALLSLPAILALRRWRRRRPSPPHPATAALP